MYNKLDKRQSGLTVKAPAEFFKHTDTNYWRQDRRQRWSGGSQWQRVIRFRSKCGSLAPTGDLLDFNPTNWQDITGRYPATLLGASSSLMVLAGPPSMRRGAGGDGGAGWRCESLAGFSYWRVRLDGRDIQPNCYRVDDLGDGEWTNVKRSVSLNPF